MEPSCYVGHGAGWAPSQRRVKAAGGGRSLDLLELAEAGATRFGATATEAILDDRGERPVAAASAGAGY